MKYDIIAEYWCGELVHKETYKFKRLNGIGEPIVLNYQPYLVRKVDYVPNVSVRYELEKCEMCKLCGGVIGSKERMVGCTCHSVTT